MVKKDISSYKSDRSIAISYALSSIPHKQKSFVPEIPMTWKHPTLELFKWKSVTFFHRITTCTRGNQPKQ